MTVSMPCSTMKMDMSVLWGCVVTTLLVYRTPSIKGNGMSGMADEGCGFYVGMFTVVGGLIFIVSMGVWSIYNPFKGKMDYNRISSY